MTPQDPTGLPGEPVSPGGGEPLPTDVRVPDDLSGLEAEVIAVRRELRAQRRRARWARLAHRMGHHRVMGLGGPVLAAVLLAAGVFGVLTVLLQPRASGPSQAPTTPALAQPTARPGGVGGLLPAASLVYNGNPLATSSLRPALIALLPQRCSCARALHDIVAASQLASMRAWFIAHPGDTQVPLLESAPDAGDGLAYVAVDPTGVLYRTFAAGPRSITLILVRSDGLVQAVLRRFTGGDELTRLLAGTAGPSAPATISGASSPAAFRPRAPRIAAGARTRV